MALEPALAPARFAPIVALLLFIAAPAHALKVATWNLMAYESPGEGPGTPSPFITSRQANFRTVMAALDPDVIVAEEINSQAAADSFRLDVLGNVAPGAWSGQWVSVGGNEGMALFYKTTKVTISNVGAVITGGPRSAFVSLVKPVGYVKNGAWFRLYAVHFKAGTLAADVARRDGEAGSLRATLNSTTTTVVGSNFIVCGDMNLYDGTEGAYLRLTESQASNNRPQLRLPGPGGAVAPERHERRPLHAVPLQHVQRDRAVRRRPGRPLRPRAHLRFAAGRCGSRLRAGELHAVRQ